LEKKVPGKTHTVPLTFKQETHWERELQQMDEQVVRDYSKDQADHYRRDPFRPFQIPDRKGDVQKRAEGQPERINQDDVKCQEDEIDQDDPYPFAVRPVDLGILSPETPGFDGKSDTAKQYEKTDGRGNSARGQGPWHPHPDHRRCIQNEKPEQGEETTHCYIDRP